MGERVQMIVPEGTRAYLVRKGQKLLSWPTGSIVDHTLEADDEIVNEALKPIPPATALDILKLKATRADQELADTDHDFLRILDVVVERLIAGNVLRTDQLPQAVQTFWSKRKAIRNRIAQLKAEIQALVDKP